MAEIRRADALEPEAASERDGRIEALLVEGLDCYFSGRYEDAIHLWTRVLFLDRSHARARAYIDRARTALAERLRRSEEMLHASQALLDRGETGAARDLLVEVVAASGDDERAAALRVRLERVERAHAASYGPARVSAAVAPEVVAGWTWPRSSGPLALTAAACVAVALIAATWWTTTRGGWMELGTIPDAAIAGVGPAPLTVPSSADVALIRARNLYTTGRLPEALRALDRVDADSPLHADADRLRIEIQRRLLSAQLDPGATGGGR